MIKLPFEIWLVKKITFIAPYSGGTAQYDEYYLARYFNYKTPALVGKNTITQVYKDSSGNIYIKNDVDAVNCLLVYGTSNTAVAVNRSSINFSELTLITAQQ